MMKKKIYLSCPAEKKAELNAKAKVLFSDHVLVPKVTQANLILCVGTPDSTQDLDLEVGQTHQIPIEYVNEQFEVRPIEHLEQHVLDNTYAIGRNLSRDRDR